MGYLYYLFHPYQLRSIIQWQVYILSALVWLWLVEGVHPDRWDVLGATVCLAGAAIILYGPRSH